MGIIKKVTKAVRGWFAQPQPEWYVAAVRKTITELPDGYREAVSWIGEKKTPGDGGTTYHSLINRLRSHGDQYFPIGWAILLQKVGGNYHIADVIARESGGVFIPMPEMDEIDNADINEKLLEAFEEVSRYSQLVRDAIEDGVVEPHEFEQLKDGLYRATVKLQEHLNLVSKIYSPSEELNAPGCSPERSVAINFRHGDKTA